MVLVEYNENAEDHRSILLLLQQVGSHMTPKNFSKMYDRISKIHVHRITSPKRNIHLRYKKFYPPASSDWGEFQAHRKVIGLVSLAQCNSVEELPDLYKLYGGVKQQYGSTLFDSRLIIFGIDPKKPGSSKTPTPNSTMKGMGVMSASDKDKKVVVNGKEKVTYDNEGVIGNKGLSRVENKETFNEKDGVCNNNQVVEAEETNSVSSSDTVGKDSGKGDSLDSRNSIEAQRLELEEDGQSTDSDTDCQSNGNEAMITCKEDPGVSSSLDLPDDTKPRSGSTISHDSNSSTSSFVKEAPPYVIFYPAMDSCLDLEEKVGDFVDSLFWVLESKRLDRSQEKLDRMPMLAAPFEKKDLIGVDTEGRNYKKRCQGHFKKQQGDLCLLAGLPGEAIMHYQTAMEMLKSANDWLWLGAAQEGLCSAYVITALPKIESSSSLTRNHSFSLTRGTNAVKEATRIATGTLRGAPSGLDLYEGKPRLPDDLGSRYKEAVSNYCKFKNAAVIEMECSIKACRVLASQKVHILSLTGQVKMSTEKK